LKKRIVYIWEFPFTGQHYKYYFIKYLKNFFNIKIIDFSKIFYSKLKLFRDRNFYKPTTLLEFKKKINFNKVDYVVLDGSEVFKKKIYNLLKKYKIKFINFQIHYPEYDRITFKILLKIIIDFKIRFIFIVIYKLFKKKFEIFKNLSYKFKKKLDYKLDLIFVAGDLAKQKFINNTNIVKIVETCSYEYVFKPNIIYNKKYCVFLDNLTFTHPDFLINKLNININHNYYLLMKNFFNIIERNLKIKIIIAAHPKTSLNKFKHLYPSYEIVKNKTPELVFSAQFVMAHSTTSSINFAVLYKKPIIFITTDELEKKYQYIKSMLFKNAILKQPVINVNQEINYLNFNNYNKVNLNGYEEFIYKFMKTKNADLLLKKNILEEIKKL
jgi:hypothetical protein